jgi:hypothetical protein
MLLNLSEWNVTPMYSDEDDAAREVWDELETELKRGND